MYANTCMPLRSSLLLSSQAVEAATALQVLIRGIHPRGTRVVIWFDDDSSVTVSGLHIVAIEKAAAKNGARKKHG